MRLFLAQQRPGKAGLQLASGRSWRPKLVTFVCMLCSWLGWLRRKALPGDLDKAGSPCRSSPLSGLQRLHPLAHGGVQCPRHPLPLECREAAFGQCARTRWPGSAQDAQRNRHCCFHGFQIPSGGNHSNLLCHNPRPPPTMQLILPLHFHNGSVLSVGSGIA